MKSHYEEPSDPAISPLFEERATLLFVAPHDKVTTTVAVAIDKRD